MFKLHATIRNYLEREREEVRQWQKEDQNEIHQEEAPGEIKAEVAVAQPRKREREQTSVNPFFT